MLSRIRDSREQRTENNLHLAGCPPIGDEQADEGNSSSRAVVRLLGPVANSFLDILAKLQPL